MVQLQYSGMLQFMQDVSLQNEEWSLVCARPWPCTVAVSLWPSVYAVNPYIGGCSAGVHQRVWYMAYK